MLKVQEYLRSGNSLRQLSQEHNIQCNICSELDLVALNYTSFSDTTNPMVLECKGLFLELDTWDVACKSFGKFPQGTSAGIDWDSARLLEKLDGALVCLYYYKDAWRIGMRMSADGSMQVSSVNGVPTSLSFAELTKLTLSDMGYEWEDYCSKLNRNIFYSFELVGTETRVGVIYSKRRLVLTGAVQKITLNYIDIFGLDFPIEKPLSYPVYSLDDIGRVITSHNDPLKYEGFVLHDNNYNRKKMINPNYVEMMSDPVSENDLSQLEDMLREVIAFTTAGSIEFYKIHKSDDVGSGGTGIDATYTNPFPLQMAKGGIANFHMWIRYKGLGEGVQAESTDVTYPTDSSNYSFSSEPLATDPIYGANRLGYVELGIQYGNDPVTVSISGYDTTGNVGIQTFPVSSVVGGNGSGVWINGPFTVTNSEHSGTYTYGVSGISYGTNTPGKVISSAAVTITDGFSTDATTNYGTFSNEVIDAEIKINLVHEYDNASFDLKVDDNNGSTLTQGFSINKLNSLIISPTDTSYVNSDPDYAVSGYTFSTSISCSSLYSLNIPTDADIINENNFTAWPPTVIAGTWDDNYGGPVLACFSGTVGNLLSNSSFSVNLSDSGGESGTFSATLVNV